MLSKVLYRSVLHLKQFRYLGAFYLHSVVRLFAVSIFEIFTSIYIYQQLLGYGANPQHALGITALTFALIFLVQALCTAPALWIISKKGLRFAVFWGNIFLVGFFGLLYLARYEPIFLVLAAVLGGAQIGLYWNAFHIYFTELTDDKKQGEEVAISVSLSAIASIGGPAFGGLIISYAGFEVTFLIMTILVILASLPLKFLPKDKDIVKVDILKTVLALAPKREEKSYLALFGAGIIDATASNLWPLYVFSILTGFVGVGFMGSLVAFFATITTIVVGFLIDKFSAKNVLRTISSLDSLVWISKIFVTTPFQVFTVSSASALTTPGQLIALDSLVYERARHSNIVAYIIQREIGLSVGKTVFLLVLGVLFWFGLPLVTVFILTALAALATRLYPENTKERS